MKKILLTGANGMFATDFIKYWSSDFEIIWFDRMWLDITDFETSKKNISEIMPDIILNAAAYTAVDDAEDIGKLKNFEINTLWVYHLAKISKELNIDYITLSTDYVFDGQKKEWYAENDIQNPINEYGMSKYLWEKLALQENKNSIIIRTSWLYGGGKEFKNFVNTMLKLSQTKTELKVVNDQFWIPTFTKDLAFAIWEVIESISEYRWNILHFSNTSLGPITWFDFAKKIFEISKKNIHVIACSSTEFQTKAKRPQFSLLKNNSNIQLRNWEDWLKNYLNTLQQENQ